MPPQPRNIAAEPTPAKRQPIKPVRSVGKKSAAPPPPEPGRARAAVQLPSWRSSDGRLRIEDRGFALVVFSDGRPAGELTEDDAVNLMAALVLATMRKEAKRGTLGGATGPLQTENPPSSQVGSGDTTGTNPPPAAGGKDGPEAPATT